jgi:hypothetical protein
MYAPVKPVRVDGSRFLFEVSDRIPGAGMRRHDINDLSNFLMGSALGAYDGFPATLPPAGSEVVFYITLPEPGEDFTFGVGDDTQCRGGRISSIVYVNGPRVLESLKKGNGMVFGADGAALVRHEVDHGKRWETIASSDGKANTAYGGGLISPGAYNVIRTGIEFATESVARSAEASRRIVVIPGMFGDFSGKISAVGGMGAEGLEYFRREIMMEGARSDAMVPDVETMGGMTNGIIASHIILACGGHEDAGVTLRLADREQMLKPNELAAAFNSGIPIAVDLSPEAAQRTYDALSSSFDASGPLGVVKLGKEAFEGLGLKSPGHGPGFTDMLYRSLSELDSLV